MGTFTGIILNNIDVDVLVDVDLNVFVVVMSDFECVMRPLEEFDCRRPINALDCARVLQARMPSYHV